MILQRRVFPEHAWYLDNYRVINGDQITKVSDVVLASEPTPNIFDSEKDNVIIVESYEEMIEHLSILYTVIFRLHDNFKKDTRYIWIDEDADLIWGNRMIGKKRRFIGKYELPHWPKIRHEIREACERRLLVRVEWIERYRDELIMEGLM